jgi:hypothetical protein
MSPVIIILHGNIFGGRFEIMRSLLLEIHTLTLNFWQLVQCLWMLRVNTAIYFSLDAVWVHFFSVFWVIRAIPVSAILVLPPDWPHCGSREMGRIFDRPTDVIASPYWGLFYCCCHHCIPACMLTCLYNIFELATSMFLGYSVQVRVFFCFKKNC